MRRLGGYVFVARGRLRCLDCGTHIRWRKLLRRSWRYCACPSCEGFMKYMIEGRDGDMINPDHPVNYVPENRDGPRHYTPEQARVIKKVTAQRKPLPTEPFPFDD